jgi:hypothetical protein
MVPHSPANPAIVSRENAWLLAFAMFASSVGEFLGYAHYMHIVNKGGWRLREALVGSLFKSVAAALSLRRRHRTHTDLR